MEWRRASTGVIVEVARPCWGSEAVLEARMGRWGAKWAERAGGEHGRATWRVRSTFPGLSRFLTLGIESAHRVGDYIQTSVQD